MLDMLSRLTLLTTKHISSNSLQMSHSYNINGHFSDLETFEFSRQKSSILTALHREIQMKLK